MFAEAIGEHRGVDGWMADEEGGAEAGGEGGLWFFDAIFGAGDAGGVTTDEVVHGLLGGEAADGGQDAEGITGEEDDVARVAADAGDLGVGDVLDGVSGAGVFGDGGAVVIDGASFFVVDDVFEHRAEADGIVNFGFARAAEFNALGVAAAFDVEDAIVGPTMFVVADELAAWIGGEGGFAGAGEAEEEGDVGVWGGLNSSPLTPGPSPRSRGENGRAGCSPGGRGETLAFVGGAVHREDAAARHDVVHQGEDALFHFAGVFGAEDDHLAALEADIDAGARGHLVRVGIGGELAGVVDDVVGLAEIGQLFERGADEHVAHEERMIGASADDADLDAVRADPNRRSHRRRRAAGEC